MTQLEIVAKRVRQMSLEMIYQAGSGHPGGSLSCADIITYLYFKEMNLQPENPNWMGRDRFVLSKGHACPALYAALAIRGYFSTEEFLRFRQVGGLLQGHPAVTIPGVEAVSGSLGMGLSQGLGMALGARCSGVPFRAYVLLGDGDMEEGCTWEAIMAAGHHRIDNLVAILDANEFQGDGAVVNQMDYNPVSDKVLAFRWHFIEIDGHDFGQIGSALEEAKGTKGKPTFVLARTVKGKGVSFMERDNAWHGSRSPTDEEFNQAMVELKEAIR